MTGTESRAPAGPTAPAADAGGGGDRVVIAFVAPWCGACRRLAPVLETVAARHHPTVRLVTVSVDEDPDRAAERGVRATPTIVVLHDGREVARHVGGGREDELERLFGIASSADAAATDAGRTASRTDVTLRLGAGTTLVAAGLLAGGQPILLLAGASVVAWAAAPRRVRRPAGAAPAVPHSHR